MIFYCRDCDTEFEVDDNECRGYYNWKCPECNHIANQSGVSGLGVVWKCDTGTVKRGGSCNNENTKSSSNCSSCTSSKAS